MHKLLLFLSFWFIASESLCQSPSAAFPDTPTITEHSVGKAQIGMPAVTLKALYKGCSFVPTYMMPYGFDDTNNKPSGIMVISNGQQLFIYWLDWQTKKKVAGFLTLHSAYKTANGIHVGTTSSQLKTALPAVQVVPNMLLPVFQIAFLGDLEKPGIEYIFYKQNELGKYVDESAKIIVPDVKISWIQVRANQ